MNHISVVILFLFMSAKCDNKIHPASDDIPLRDVIAAISKTLYIARHAKSSWDDTSLPDFVRPLAKRGEKDAPRMGKILHSKGVQPDLIISSPAKRAISTAHILADEINYPIENIVADKEIYEAGTSKLLDIITQLDDKFKCVMLIGHNPSFTQLANYLTGRHFDNIPTCGVVAIEFDVTEWKTIEKNSGKIIFFEYPKKHIE